MKIIRNDTSYLADLCPGDVFEFEGRIYIVTDHCTDGCNYAIDLSNGEELYLDFEAVVSVFPNAMIKLV